MATLGIYARLEKPPMFRPSEPVTFKLYYSESLRGNDAVLIIGGYRLPGFYGEHRKSFTLEASVGGQGYQEITIDKDVLGADIELSSYSVGRPMKARVEVHGQVSENIDGETVIKTVTLCTSNEIIVDMLYMFVGKKNADFGFVYPKDKDYFETDSSRFVLPIRYYPRTPLGRMGSTEAASYRVLLCNESKQLIYDSGARFDWDSNSIHPYRDFVLKDLKDNTTYYAGVYITLGGGYTIKIEPDGEDAAKIIVKYAEVKPVSSSLKLTNDLRNGCVSIYYKVPSSKYSTAATAVVSRTEINSGETITLGKMAVNKEEQFVTYNDYYAIPGKEYQYQVTPYTELGFAMPSVTNIITHKSSVVTIADAFGAYSAVGEIKKHPITRNDRGETIEVMDNDYPYYIVNGLANYESGSVNGLFAETEDCKINTDNTVYSNALRKWLNNGNIKFLKHYTGEAWLVKVGGISTDDTDNTDVVNTSFNWVQVGEADDITSYPKLGLVIE